MDDENHQDRHVQGSSGDPHGEFAIPSILPIGLHPAVFLRSESVAADLSSLRKERSFYPVC